MEGDRIQREFEMFHAANPRVYAEICTIAREYARAGMVKVGIAHIWEVMRWSFFMETKTPEAIKLNNNHRSRYARLVMEREADLATFFRTRRLSRRGNWKTVKAPYMNDPMIERVEVQVCERCRHRDSTREVEAKLSPTTTAKVRLCEECWDSWGTFQAGVSLARLIAMPGLNVKVRTESGRLYDPATGKVE